MKAVSSELFLKKVFSKSRQKPSRKNGEGAHSLAKLQTKSLQPYPKKKLPTGILQGPYPDPELLFITFYNSKNAHFSEHLLLVASVVNTARNLTFHWSKHLCLSYWNYLLNHTVNKQLFLGI